MLTLNRRSSQFGFTKRQQTAGAASTPGTICCLYLRMHVEQSICPPARVRLFFFYVLCLLCTHKITYVERKLCKVVHSDGVTGEIVAQNGPLRPGHLPAAATL